MPGVAALTLRRIRNAVAVVTSAIVVAGAAAFVRSPGPIVRRMQFRLTGAISVDQGFSLFLHPKDKVITPIMIEEGAWEPAESRYIRERLRTGDTFIDIGACIGYYTVLAARTVGPRGRVIAFEPEAENAALLRRNVARNALDNVSVEEKAVSNRNGTVGLYLAGDNKGDHSIFPRGDPRPRVDVAEVRLDDYLASHPGRVDLVKIDTQGAEGFIVEGMQQTVEANPGISVVLEFWPLGLSDAHYEAAHLLDVIESRGLSIQEIVEDADEVRPATAPELLGTYTVENGRFTNLVLTHRLKT